MAEVSTRPASSVINAASHWTGEAATQTDRHSNGGTGGEWSTIYTRVAWLIEYVHYDLEYQNVNVLNVFFQFSCVCVCALTTETDN